jgi:hypothetical protein
MSLWKSSAKKRGYTLLPLPFSPDQKLRIGFSLLWVTLALLQAASMDLLPDEAYYRLYSLHPAWGYFDHPPMIAMLIKAGSLFHAAELGVRLGSIIISLTGILLLERWVRPEKLWLFYLSISGIALIHAGSFLAIPDIPLFFFSLAYLILLKWYLESGKWYAAIALALTAALMLYSKYHGILLIGFSLLALPRLWLKWHFWLIPVITGMLFLPHLNWQYQNNWPSIAYHLFDRSPQPWELKFTLHYLWSQILLPGPLPGTLLVILAFFHRSANQYERMLKILMLGIYAFFLMMSFKGPVEAHWTLLALLPAIYLGYPVLEAATSRYKRLVPIVLGLSLLILLMGRIWLAVPGEAYGKNPFRGWQSWAEALRTRVGERPIVFLNSYQKAALYEFYTGTESFSLNNANGRSNQYDLLNRESRLQGQAVMVVPNWPANTFDSVNTARGWEYFFPDSCFVSYNRIKIRIKELRSGLPGAKGDCLLGFYGQDSTAARLLEQNPAMIQVLYYQHGHIVKQESTGIWFTPKMLEAGSQRITFPLPSEAGDYLIRFSLVRYPYPGGLQCPLSKISVK